MPGRQGDQSQAAAPHRPGALQSPRAAACSPAPTASSHLATGAFPVRSHEQSLPPGLSSHPRNMPGADLAARAGLLAKILVEGVLGILYIRPGYAFDGAKLLGGVKRGMALPRAAVTPVGAPLKDTGDVNVQICMIAGCPRPLVLKTMSLQCALHLFEAAALEWLGVRAQQPLGTMTDLVAVLVTPAGDVIAVYTAADCDMSLVARDIDTCFKNLASACRQGLRTDSPDFKSRYARIMSVFHRCAAGVAGNAMEVAQHGFQLQDAKCVNYGLVGVPAELRQLALAGPRHAWSRLDLLANSLPSWRVVALDWGMFVRSEDHAGAGDRHWVAGTTTYNATPDHLPAASSWEELEPQLPGGRVPAHLGPAAAGYQAGLVLQELLFACAPLDVVLRQDGRGVDHPATIRAKFEGRLPRLESNQAMRERLSLLPPSLQQLLLNAPGVGLLCRDPAQRPALASMPSQPFFCEGWGPPPAWPTTAGVASAANTAAPAATPAPRGVSASVVAVASTRARVP